MAGRGSRRAPGEYINLPSNAAADVDAYFEYRAYEIKIIYLNIAHFVFIVLLVMMMEDNCSRLKSMKIIKSEFYRW